MSARPHLTGHSRATAALAATRTTTTTSAAPITASGPREHLSHLHELHAHSPHAPPGTRVHVSGDRTALLLGDCSASVPHTDRTLAEAPDTVTAADRLGALPGSHSVVVTEGPDLVWAGDLAGTHRLWYRQEPDGVRFASSPTAPRLSDAPRADLDGLAVFLFLPDLCDLLGTTPVRGACAVTPRHLMHVREGRAALHPRSFPRPESSLEQGAALLRAALLHSVGHHCGRGEPVSCDLSGGLDSSTLAVLAARAADDPVTALTYRDRLACNRDDLAHAERIAHGNPGLEWTVVEGGPGTLPFHGLSEVPQTDTPSLDQLLWARTRARLAPATREGVHLVGDGGDVVLGAPLTYLAALARPRYAHRFAAEARALARLRQRPVHRVARAGLRTARTGFGAALAELAARLSPGLAARPLPGSGRVLESGISWLPVDATLAWATAPARARLARRLGEAAADLGPEHEGADAHALRLLHRHGDATRSFLALSEQAGVRVEAPFFDNGVVAACLGVPAPERATALDAKPLLRSAAAGLAPARLYERRTKGDYGACEYHGLRRNAAEVRALLRDGLLFASGLVRPGPVLDALDLAVSGGRAPMAELQRALAVEMWLRALDTRPRPAARPHASRPIGATP